MHVVARANWTCLKDFFWRRKWGETKERKEKCRKKERVIYRVGERQRPRKRERERNPVILFIMYSHGEKRGWDDHG